MSVFTFIAAPELYLDPGSGSILFQIIVATLLGGVVAVRIMWGRITNFFRRGSGEAGEDQNNPKDEDQVE